MLPERSSHSCEFCIEFDDSGRAGSRFATMTGLAEDRSVAISGVDLLLPSLGALSRGHTLLVPRSHVHAFVGSGPPVDVENRLRVASELVASVYGPLVIFEHGTWSPRSSGGCGVCHAHVHLVPVPGDCPDLLPAEYVWSELPATGWAAHIARHGLAVDYLLYWPPSAAPVVAYDNSAPSQLLRKHVAGLLGFGSWNWRDSTDTDGLLETTDLLNAALRQEGRCLASS